MKIRHISILVVVLLLADQILKIWVKTHQWVKLIQIPLEHSLFLQQPSVFFRMLRGYILALLLGY